MADSDPVEAIIDPHTSPLGSKEHWNAAYERELANFEENRDDVGEIWFGEDVQERVCDWIGLGCEGDDGEEDDETMGSEAFPGIRHFKSRVLDIGCGNAAALVYLAKEYGFEQLTGIDYSEPGIGLAKKIVAKDEATQNINLQVVDLMDLELLFNNITQAEADYKFDLLFDKGTFDAICLNEDKSMRNKYVAAVVAMMKPTSYFVITSCNWTQSEVIPMFESMSTFDTRAKEHTALASLAPSSSLKLFKTLKQPEFSFGGRSGSTVATVAFCLSSK
jgi:SAM-dependent methyltransferase